jgi:hypothetical protein
MKRETQDEAVSRRGLESYKLGYDLGWQRAVQRAAEIAESWGPSQYRATANSLSRKIGMAIGKRIRGESSEDIVKATGDGLLRIMKHLAGGNKL